MNRKYDASDCALTFHFEREKKISFGWDIASEVLDRNSLEFLGVFEFAFHLL